MIERCQKAGLPEPEFKLTDGFVITLRRKPDRAFASVGGEVTGKSQVKSQGKSPHHSPASHRTA